MKKIYIILMNTGTIPGNIIKEVTNYKYSHVVLSLDEKYEKLYSFGRKKLYNFLESGFVTDGIDSKFFKRFSETMCAVYELNISNKKYKDLEKILNEYENNMDVYKYDIKGLILRIFYKNAKVRDNYYVCCSFVGSVLEEADIYHFSKKIQLIKPKDFTQIKGIVKVYEGKFLNLKN